MHRRQSRSVFLLRYNLFLAGQAETLLTLAIVNPDCTVNIFNQVFIAEAAMHSVHETVMQDTTAMGRFTLRLQDHS